MNSKNIPSNTSSKFDPEYAVTVAERTLGSEPPTHLTSAYPEMFTSNLKGTSWVATGPSLLLSDPSIPPSTSGYSSRPTTGAPSSTSKGIPSGPQSTDSNGQWESAYPLPGSSTSAGLKLPPEPGAFNYSSIALAPATVAGPYIGMTEHRHGALDKQIGGTHYKDFPIQPIEFIHKNSIGFIAGNVIKYVCRYKAKGGTTDLLKAKHYIEMLIEQERQDP